MPYKIGDKVRIKKCYEDVSITFADAMKKWLGKTMTIKYVGYSNNEGYFYYMEEDVGEGYPRDSVSENHWCFVDEDIEGYAEITSIKICTLL